MIRLGETDWDPPATAPPTRRRAALGLAAAAWLAPALARAQAPAQPRSAGTPSSGAQPAGAPSSGQPPPGGSEALQTGRDSSNRMTTPVYVNGKGPFNFFVDTGANRSGITREIATQLNLPAGQPTIVNGIAAAALTPTVDIDDLRAGSFHIRLRDAPVFTRENLGADGLIGLDLLRDRLLTLDFAANRIEVSRHVYLTDAMRSVFGQAYNGVTIPARQRFGQLTIIDANAGRTRLTCFIDTGADESVGNEALRRAVQAETPAGQYLSLDVLIRSATGQTMPAKLARVPSMRIGDLRFSSFGLAFADLHTFELWQLQDRPALLVGMDLLRLFDVVTLDFADRSVTFEKA